MSTIVGWNYPTLIDLFRLLLMAFNVHVLSFVCLSNPNESPFLSFSLSLRLNKSKFNINIFFPMCSTVIRPSGIVKWGGGRINHLPNRFVQIWNLPSTSALAINHILNLKKIRLVRLLLSLTHSLTSIVFSQLLWTTGYLERCSAYQTYDKFKVF